MIGELAPSATTRPDKSIPAYDEVISRADKTDDSTQRVRVANALFYKGFELRALGRSQEAVESYDDLVGRFGDTVEPELREYVASALLEEGAAFLSLGRPEAAVAVWDDLCARLKDDPEFRERVEWLKDNRDVLLGEIGWERAGVILDHLIAHFGQSLDPLAEEWLSYLMSSKANELVRGGRDDLARAAYEDLVARFGRSRNRKVAEYVAEACAQHEAIAKIDQDAG
jgi:tetratricopeptide (TPR) repeat protein